MRNVLMIMNARNIAPFKDCVDKLNIDKVWFKGYTEFELNTHINKFIQETDYDNYFLAPDDLLIKKHHFELLERKLQYHDIVTGWGVWRQNYTWTTIYKQDRLYTYGQGPSLPLFKKHYNLVKTYEVDSLPDEIETAFTGWFFTGAKRQVWLEYPYQTLAVHKDQPGASTDLHWSKRILEDKKYKQICIKDAKVTHISYIGKDYLDLNFDTKEIKYEQATTERVN